MKLRLDDFYSIWRMQKQWGFVYLIVCIPTFKKNSEGWLRNAMVQSWYKIPNVVPFLSIELRVSPRFFDLLSRKSRLQLKFITHGLTAKNPLVEEKYYIFSKSPASILYYYEYYFGFKFRYALDWILI